MSNNWYCISRKRNGTLNVQPLGDVPGVDLTGPTICKDAGSLTEHIAWIPEEHRFKTATVEYEVFFDRAALLKPFPAPAVEIAGNSANTTGLTRFPLPCFINATASIAGKLRLTHLSAW